MATYELTKLESKLAEKFNKKHYKKCNSGVSIILTETGIGLAVEIRCNKCNKIKSITDISDW